MKEIELLHGDCIDLMQDIPSKSVDCIFTDLPYGTTKCAWDTPVPLDKMWEQYCRIIKDSGAILLFAQPPFDKVLGVSNIGMFRYEWIWEKTSATGHYNAKKMPMKAHENILVFYKKLPAYHPQMTEGCAPVHSFRKTVIDQNRTELYGAATKEIHGGGSTLRYPRDVLKFPSDKQRSHLHPTQKPVELCEYLIRTYTDEHDTVLDSCMGSGTTGVAARNLNRRFVGIELNRKYFDIAYERIMENGCLQNNSTA